MDTVESILWIGLLWEILCVNIMGPVAFDFSEIKGLIKGIIDGY